MTGTYILAAPVLLLAAAGTLMALRGAIFAGRRDWLLIIGVLFAFAWGLGYMQIKTPYYGAAKSFYALALLLPLSLLVAEGAGGLVAVLERVRLGMLGI